MIKDEAYFSNNFLLRQISLLYINDEHVKKNTKSLLFLTNKSSQKKKQSNSLSK